MNFKNFNIGHPELRPGEAFLRNDADCGFSRVRAVLPSARQGQTAYNVRGEKLTMDNFKPIFVSPSELKAAGGSLMLEVRYAEMCESQHA